MSASSWHLSLVPFALPAAHECYQPDLQSLPHAAGQHSCFSDDGGELSNCMIAVGFLLGSDEGRYVGFQDDTRRRSRSRARAPTSASHCHYHLHTLGRCHGMSPRRSPFTVVGPHFSSSRPFGHDCPPPSSHVPARRSSLHVASSSFCHLVASSSPPRELSHTPSRFRLPPWCSYFVTVFCSTVFAAMTVCRTRVALIFLSLFPLFAFHLVDSITTSIL